MTYERLVFAEMGGGLRKVLVLLGQPIFGT